MKSTLPPYVSNLPHSRPEPKSAVPGSESPEGSGCRINRASPDGRPEHAIESPAADIERNGMPFFQPLPPYLGLPNKFEGYAANAWKIPVFELPTRASGPPDSFDAYFGYRAPPFS